MNITVLCKVVDNYGDVGVVYRLIRQLNRIRPEVNINLVIDDLTSFNKLNDRIIPKKSFQKIDEYSVYDWNNFDFCYERFKENDGEKLEIILECFQCGRPDWMEKILFEDKLERTVNILMIDYLTAEDYAEDFHCLNSLTRSSKVKKINFMPGFTNKTGGLTLDEQWETPVVRDENGPTLIFTYERNWDSLVRALNKSDIDKVFVAQGRGFESFMESVCRVGDRKSIYNALSYLNQTDWDKMFKNCSLLFIRGEESMSRACLSGIPFVWHAYPQSDEYQLVKVKALLKRMEKYFTPEDFSLISKVWIYINTPEKEIEESDIENALFEFIMARNKIEYGFKDFAADLRKNGDLATNLMTFIEKNIIMNKSYCETNF